MQKKTHLLTVAALSLFLVACGDKQPTTTSTTPPPPEPMASTPAPDPVPPELVGATAPTNSDVVPGTLTTTQDAAAPMDNTAPATTATAPAAGGMAPVSDTAMGKGVYDKACASCHVAGVAGAPKLNDKGDWAPRIAQGKDTLYKHTIEGYTGSKGVHPARGGNSTLSDDELKASVDYMTSQAI